jgi:hypothetical protein
VACLPEFIRGAADDQVARVEIGEHLLQTAFG